MKKILIVEDEPDIQELLCAYLEDAGYKAFAAGDGVEALAAAMTGTLILFLACVGEAAFFYGRYFHWYQLGRLMIFVTGWLGGGG